MGNTPYLAWERLKWLAGVAAVLVLLVSPACRRVSKPTSDSSPPKLRWDIFNHNTNEAIQKIGNATINVNKGDRFRVTLIAEDPQGIHEITLGSSTAWGCTSGSVGQQHGPSLDVLDKQTLQPDSQGNVLTKIILLRDANLGPFNCQSGFTFTGGNVTMMGTGKNYFNQTTKANLVLKVP